MQLLGMLTLRKSAELSILPSKIILTILYIHILEWLFYRTICKMPKKAGLWNTEQPIRCEIGHVTLPNLLGNVMSSISRHWPSFRSFWWVELKWVLKKSQTRAQILRHFLKIWLAVLTFGSRAFIFYCAWK